MGGRKIRELMGSTKKLNKLVLIDTLGRPANPCVVRPDQRSERSRPDTRTANIINLSLVIVNSMGRRWIEPETSKEMEIP